MAHAGFRSILAAVLGLSMALAAAEAGAQSDDYARARVLFEQGLTAADRGETDRAEQLFRESIALRRSGSALFNLARLLEEREELVEALRLYEEVAAMDDVPPEVASLCRDRLAALAPRLAELVDEGEPERTPDEAAAEPPAEEPEEAAATGEPPEPSATVDHGGSPDLLGPALLLSVGGAVLAAGTVTGSVATVWQGQLNEDCPNRMCGPDELARAEDGRALALATDVLLPLGGAVAVAGLVWLVVEVSRAGGDDVAARGDRLELRF